MSMASWIVPDRRHRWSSKTHAVETVDGSLTLHVAVRSARKAESYRLQVSVLLDYAPVPATITIWNGRRSEKIRKVKGTGTWLELDEQAAAVDIEIPAGTIPMGRWRELQTVVELAPLSRFDTADADVRRWIVHAGAAPPAARNCTIATPKKIEPMFERLTAAGVTSAWVVPETPPDDWPHSNEVSSNSTLRFATRAKSGETVAAVLLVGGEPIGEPMFVRATEKSSIVEASAAQAERSGPAVLATWNDPYFGRAGATNFRSSNVVWIAGP
jgi:hypothetical protein